MSSLKFTSADKVIETIADGARLMLPGGCCEPTAFYDALIGGIDRFRDLRITSGLQFGRYRFLDRGLNENFSYTTWHVGAGARKLARAREISYLPLRYSEIAPAFSEIDVLVVQVSPPVDGGNVSLGISVSINVEFIKAAKCVVAEVNENMPVTRGDGLIPTDAIDYFIEGPGDFSSHARGATRDVERQIAERVMTLLPEDACVQMGIGGVPEAFCGMLAGRKDIRIYTGMVTDEFIPFIERTNSVVVAGEAMGTAELFQFIDHNPKVELRAVGVTHNPAVIGAIPRFVSVNSAIEVDLTGQVNAEAIGSAPISGIGGSMDYSEAAARSVGGMTILALESTAARGTRSRIVSGFAPGTPVTVPRHMVNFVVTEFGIADLRGKTLKERGVALAQIAHPNFRDELREAAEQVS